MTEEEKKVWVKRNFVYRKPSPNYDVGDRSSLRQCANVYIPLHYWGQHEHAGIQKRVNRLMRHSWRPKCRAAEEEIEGELPLIIYAVGGSWLTGDRSQRNVHEILTTLAAEVPAVCVSVGYRVCRMRSRYIDLGLLGMALFCFLTVASLHDMQSTYFKATWLMMGLFFLFLLVVAQLMRSKPNNLYPVPAEDVAAAIRWSHRHAGTFGARPDRIVLAGHSAGAHLLTQTYAHPRLWKLTKVPRPHVCAVVAISGVYSAAHMQGDFMFRSIGKLVFGDGNWNECFPTETSLCYSDVRWPAVLLLSAWFDYGLRSHAAVFHRVLQDRAERLEWITIRQTDHFSITCFWKEQHHRIATHVVQFIREACEQPSVS